MRVYRASSLGYSLEALVAPHLGFEPVNPPEFMQVKFDEGTRLEPIIIQHLRDMDDFTIEAEQPDINSLGDYQWEVELEVIPDIAKVVGHLDGIIECSGRRVLEIKTTTHKSFLAFKGWETNSSLIDKYKWQASAYMLATGLGHCLVMWDKDEEQYEMVTVDEPFYTLSDIARKLNEAESFIFAGQVPDGCTDFPCPYYYLHPPKDEVMKVEDGELEGLLQSWLTWDRAEKQAKRAKDDHRERILKLAGDSLAAKIKGECGVTVETYWQNESTYSVTKKEGWITRISGPRGGK